jgi:hypothetical protein
MDTVKPSHESSPGRFRRFFQCVAALLGPPAGFAFGALAATFVFDLVQQSRGYPGTLGECIGWGMVGALPGLVIGSIVGYVLSRKISGVS